MPRKYRAILWYYNIASVIVQVTPSVLDLFCCIMQHMSVQDYIVSYPANISAVHPYCVGTNLPLLSCAFADLLYIAVHMLTVCSV